MNKLILSAFFAIAAFVSFNNAADAAQAPTTPPAGGARPPLVHQGRDNHSIGAEAAKAGGATPGTVNHATPKP